MKIDSSRIVTSSTHSYSEKYDEKEHLELTINNRNNRSNEDALAISRQAQQIAPQAARLNTDLDSIDPVADLNMRMLMFVIKFLTGKEMDIFDPREIMLETSDSASLNLALSTNDNNREGFSLIYDYYESYQEIEKTSFTTSGQIKTQDGQLIKFNMTLNMSRKFMSENSISLRAGDALKDPLVLNFNGNAAELTDTKFEFDIDLDGRTDQISFVNSHSGFVALDKNEDGLINNGSELFGPQTGDGFSELSQYDDDSNLWIDENDAIYDKLRIWQKDSEGNDHLFALGQKGIGAIYLGHTDTPFLLKDEDNNTHGMIRETSVFFTEQGSVGTIQRIDLAV